MWFMADFVGDVKNGKKIEYKEVRWRIEAYQCLLSKNTWFRFFRRSGAKICVKHQMSFWGVFDGWAKSDPWVILKKSQKIAPEELKQGESRIWKLALSTLQQRFSWRHSTHWRVVMRNIK